MNKALVCLALAGLIVGGPMVSTAQADHLTIDFGSGSSGPGHFHNRASLFDVTQADYPGGSFTMVGSGRWVERSNNGTFHYVETKRSPDDNTIHLYDQYREVYI